MAEKVKPYIAVLLILVFLGIGMYGAYYMWWGHRHKILYDVKEVHVVQDKENKNIYDITYDVSVKNWWFDFSKHVYKLEDDINGSYAVWDFDGDTNYFTSSNNKTDFKIKVHFDLDTYWNEPLRLNEKQLGIEAVSTDTLEQRVLRNVVIYSQFQAYDKEGRPDYGATLYMQDQTDADIIFE
ncbi:MAG: hypothetical protein IJR60_06105 [Eubacterium sp.]|nr:hypothetical protein [Eubacterium sp.]